MISSLRPSLLNKDSHTIRLLETLASEFIIPNPLKIVLSFSSFKQFAKYYEWRRDNAKCNIG